VSDAQRRAIRSLLQVGFVQALIQLYNAFAPTDLTSEQAGAITLVATPLLVFAQNWLEDRGNIGAIQIPSYGKSPASTGANPVTDETRRLEPH
jgi:hypothetical protein